MPEATTLFESRDLYLGELRCPPDDHSWGEDAFVTHPILALPCAPTWVVRRGTERHLVNPNHVVVHQAGDEYRRERFADRGYRCLFVFPSLALVREIAAEFDPAAPETDAYRIPVGLASIDPAGFSLSRHLARYLREDPEPDRIHATDALYRIIRSVVRFAHREGSPRGPAARSGTRRAHQAIAEDVKEALTSRFAEPLTVDDLASSVHVSPYHLTRVFRRQTGFALHEYLNQLRLRMAFERIRDGHDDLASLAVELGFSSHSHLSANFRRAFGDAAVHGADGGARRRSSDTVDGMSGPAIRAAYDVWPQYDRRLREVVAAMTEEQLAIRPSPERWPIWATAGHTACQRVFWLCDFAGEPGAETTPFTDAAHYCPGDDDLDHPMDAQALVEALDASFRIVERCLDGWTVDMLADELRREDYGPDWVHTRAAVIQRVFSHDVYHCAELNETLGVAGLPQIDLWN